MSNPILAAESETQKVEIFAEEGGDELDPRTSMDNAFTMVCWHPKYELGDKHNYATPEDFMASRDYKNAKIILPIYLYDHGGIAISTSTMWPFDDKWDAGQVGFIYITRAKFRKEWSVSKKWYKTEEEAMTAAQANVKGEVEMYNQFLSGDMYWYRVMAKCECCGQSKNGPLDDYVDSCGPYYGIDAVKEAVEEAWPELAAKLK